MSSHEERSDPHPTARMHAARPSRRLHLVTIGRSSSLSHPLPASGEVRVGRASDSHVRLEDDTVSRNHAVIHVGDDGIWLVDLGSANGTVVGGRRVEPGPREPLAPGVLLSFGGVTAVLQHAPPSTRLRAIRTHAYFEARLEDECARGVPFSVAFLRAGPDADAALEEAFARCLGPVDVVAMYAPHEYEALLIGGDARAGLAVCDAIRADLAARGLSVTIGRVAFPDDARTPEALVAAACAEAGIAPEKESAPIHATAGAIEQMRPLVTRVATSDISVIILGETGVGKELMARDLHATSLRSATPMLSLNCAGLGEHLLESELFGYERGAFTGAVQAKPGRLELADGGTVFLDEVAEMPLSVQAKLLRVIEQREVIRLGALRARSIDVRFLAATNRDLESEVARGTFRQDLYFRLNGVTLTIPPLRERVEEIEPLAMGMIQQAAARARKPVPPRLAPEALALLKRYAWPGNIRELRNVLERAVVLCPGDVISLAHLPVDRLGRTLPPQRSAPPPPMHATSSMHLATPREIPTVRPPPLDPISRLERGFDGDPDQRRLIEEALIRCGGNQTLAAKALGVSRRTLITRIEQFGLPRPRKPGT
jgi:DNA-binding NtrC family response regulator